MEDFSGKAVADKTDTNALFVAAHIFLEYAIRGWSEIRKSLRAESLRVAL